MSPDVDCAEPSWSMRDLPALGLAEELAASLACTFEYTPGGEVTQTVQQMLGWIR